MNVILEIQGLNKQYKNSDFRLNDVSFSVPSGAIMGFVGENGAGKSTTIGCILNTILKDGGSVKVFGKEMNDDTPELRDDIGVVFDAANFSEDLTAEKLAKIMRKIYSKWDDQVFKEYLTKFRLPFKKKVKTFSRGMTMKIGIAIALAHHPKLLILDEATSGLDPIAREEILDVFLDFVQDENHSILVSSHITTDLEKIADYITFIQNGQIILSEKKDTLIYEYGLLRCKSTQFAGIASEDILGYRKQDYQMDVLVADKQAAKKKYRDVVIDDVTIEDVLLMLVKGEK